MVNIGVIGAGSWGTALAVLLCNNGNDVKLWAHRKEQVQRMKTTHTCDKLPGMILPEMLTFTDSIEEAVTGKDMIVLAVPSTAPRGTLEKLKPVVKCSQIVCSVSKGIAEDTLLTQCGIIEDVLGKEQLMGALSGPSHAEEVVMKLPTVVVAGAKEERVAKFLQDAFMNEVFRVYTSNDLLGIEIGASLKNVIALAAGMSDGLGFGDNTKAALINRGIKENSGLALAIGWNT